MSDKIEQQNEEIDILDILLDEDNEDPVTLFDENGKEYKFDQVAIIPLEEKLFAILKPIDEIEGIADDEAVVFRIDEKPSGETALIVEQDEPLAMRVFEEYYKLIDSQDKK